MAGAGQIKNFKAAPRMAKNTFLGGTALPLSGERTQRAD